VAYRLELPSELRGIHDMFHVSKLRQHIADLDHVMNDEPTELTPYLNYEE
jgi:hypothetical protein